MILSDVIHLYADVETSRQFKKSHGVNYDFNMLLSVGIIKYAGSGA